MTKITVYSKPSCVQCTATTRALDTAGIVYDYVDLTTNPDAMDHVQGLGYRQAPVVEAELDGVYGHQHWAGFMPAKIAELKTALEDLSPDLPEVSCG